MISLILAESSLELVPEQIQSRPSIVSHARRLGRKPSEILLDNSWHYEAMKGLQNEHKRGRPDLVHLSILEATSIPLYFKAKVRVFIHTINNKVIEIESNVRIPKSYHRFEGLFARLLWHNKIKAADGHLLLSIKNQSFPELIDELSPTRIVGLSTNGKLASRDMMRTFLSDNDTCIVVGGFQKGHFSDSVLDKITDLILFGDTPLEAHVIIARILYDCEKTIFM